MPGYTLNDRHLDALRDVVEASKMTSQSTALPWEVLEGVSRLLGCDEVVFIGINCGAQSHYFCQISRNGQVFERHTHAAAPPFWAHFQGSTHHPPWIPERFGSVTKPTDFPD